jgi:hypothetical protein
MIIHLSDLTNVDSLGFLAFTKVSVYLSCGFSTIVLPQTELLELGKERAAVGFNGTPA